MVREIHGSERHCCCQDSSSEKRGFTGDSIRDPLEPWGPVEHVMKSSSAVDVLGDT